MSEGEGAIVKRSFPTSVLSHVDPFVLMDEFFVNPNAGFPEHPHRGFEAVTYMLEGTFSHNDTTGAKATVREGGVQRVTMGKGIRHSEMPESEKLSHGIQLWVNLPKNLKQIDPDYASYDSDELPVKIEDGKKIKTIIGEGSPVNLKTAVQYYHISLKNSEYEWNVEKDQNGLIYIISGEANIVINSEELQVIETNVIIKDKPGPLNMKVRTSDNLEFIVLSGKPHNEKIYQHGSFVD